jgi:hypothetical protein
MSRQTDNKLTKAETNKSNLRTTKKSVAKRPPNLFRHSSYYRSVRSTATEATDIEKCVSFADPVTMLYTLALKDYSSEETKATWCTNEEYYNILKQCRNQIDREWTKARY